MTHSPGRISYRPLSSAHVRVGAVSTVGLGLIPLAVGVAGAFVGARASPAFPLGGGLIGFVVGLVGGGIAVQVVEGA
jgi:hypothetical protein